METPVGDGTLLWEPSEELKQQATLTRYMQWLEHEKGLRFSDQEALWEWSVNHLEDFWASIWNFFAVKASKPYTRVLADRNMPGARWFPGTELNYAEQVFRNVSPSRRALLFQSEQHPLQEVSWEELARQAGRSACGLHAQHSRNGDRISGLCEHRRDLVELSPRLRHEQCDRALQTDRAESPLCRGWVSI